MFLPSFANFTSETSFLCHVNADDVINWKFYPRDFDHFLSIPTLASFNDFVVNDS